MCCDKHAMIASLCNMLTVIHASGSVIFFVVCFAWVLRCGEHIYKYTQKYAGGLCTRCILVCGALYYSGTHIFAFRHVRMLESYHSHFFFYS
jgi:hypothetical protein